MLISNVTFMMLHEREQEFISWFAAHMPGLTASPLAGTAPRLSAMRSAGGIDHTQSEAQSIAFQMEFENAGQLQRWSDGPMAEVISAFDKAFGPEAMTFSSVFEIIPLP